MGVWPVCGRWGEPQHGRAEASPNVQWSRRPLLPRPTESSLGPVQPYPPPLRLRPSHSSELAATLDGDAAITSAGIDPNLIVRLSLLLGTQPPPSAAATMADSASDSKKTDPTDLASLLDIKVLGADLFRSSYVRLPRGERGVPANG